MDVCQRAGAWQTALQLPEALEMLGDTITLNSRMLAWLRGEQWEQALAALSSTSGSVSTVSGWSLYG